MTVSVNPPKTPVHQGSSGVAAATLPNICKMPGPPAPFVPTPLPNIGKSDNSPSGNSTSTKIEGNTVSIQGATFNSTGDVASQGTGGGIVSNNVEGPTSFAAPGSLDTKIEGKAVQQLGDQMLNNGTAGSGNPPNAGTMPGEIQGPGTPDPEAKTDPEKHLTAEFEVTITRCGRKVGVRAETENVDDGESAKFEIKQKGSTIVTVNQPIAADAAEQSWVTKAQTDDRPEPPFDLTASAAGLTADAEEKLQVLKYEDIPAAAVGIPCASAGFMSWTGKFTAELKTGQLIISTKIRLRSRLGKKPDDVTNPSPGVMPAEGPPVSAVLKTVMQAEIQGFLSNKHYFHRKDCQRGNGCDCPKERGCCWIRVKVVINFVESGEDHLVDFYQGGGPRIARENLWEWCRIKSWDHIYAHETGHLIGWYDEYGGGAVGTPPQWPGVRGGGIMWDSTTVYPEYYWNFRDWLATQTGSEWEVIPV